MTFVASVGHAQSLDAREASLQAAHHALNQMGNNSPALAIIISPYRFDAQMILSGATSLLSNIPILGFSSPAALTHFGYHTNTVVVALLGGDELQAETHWFAAYSQASSDTATRLQQLIGYEQRPVKGVLAFADGLNGNAEEFCQALPASLPIFGGLAAGDAQSNISYQFAGVQSGNGGMASAFLRGEYKFGVGYGHGWSPIGNHFRVTRSRGFWLRTLDSRPAADAYASLFGYASREWALPPLNYTSRLYPLGFEQLNDQKMLIRSPLRVEADGSFRMNAALRDGSDAYLMVGSSADCIAAVKNAVKQALIGLDGAKPVFALVLIDIAWQMLLQAKPGAEIQAIHEMLGPELPIAGGYTIGQIAPARHMDENPQFLNQHFMIILFGENSGE
ncbi:MAG: FIST N-terminal domain-containing protein [Anaerolineales bacterium]|jgi:hypothetical protein|nr:FIST N-terminal domain-containing protein [Anaerolineales bacterium]